jgi:shikimate dehydrogenase
VGAEEAWPPEGGGATLVVNATPVRDELLLVPEPGQTVVDLASNADERPTALVAAALERGCQTVDGLAVLVAQGAASFERWTGIPAPLEVMWAAVRSLRP